MSNETLVLPTSINATAVLDAVGSTQGQLLYRNASAWTALTPGTSGQVLQSAGAGANITWAADSGVESVNTVTGSGSVAMPATSGTVIIGDASAKTLTLPSISSALNYKYTFRYINPFPYIQYNGSIADIKADASEGYLYIAGSFTTINNVTYNRLARFTLSTNIIDTTWNPNMNGAVYVLAIDTTTTPHNVYAGGAFTDVNNGTTRNRLCRFASNSATVAAWDPNVANTVQTLALDTNAAMLYVGGTFTTVNGATTRNRLCRFPTGSATVDSWDPNMNGAVYGSALDTTTTPYNLYVGGAFTTVNGGTAITYLCRFPVNSATAAAWDTSSNNTVNYVTLDLGVSPSMLYVVGAITSLGGVTIAGVGRLATDGNTGDSGFVIAEGNATVNATTKNLLVVGTNVYYSNGGKVYRYATNSITPTVTLNAEYVTAISASTSNLYVLHADTTNGFLYSANFNNAGSSPTLVNNTYTPPNGSQSLLQQFITNPLTIESSTGTEKIGTQKKTSITPMLYSASTFTIQKVSTTLWNLAPGSIGFD